MGTLRFLLGWSVALLGGLMTFVGAARQWLAEPLGLDWLDVREADQVLGGDTNNYLLVCTGVIIVAIGSWIAAKREDWLRL